MEKIENVYSLYNLNLILNFLTELHRNYIVSYLLIEIHWNYIILNYIQVIILMRKILTARYRY